LTAGDEWEGHRYKDRPPKPADLTHQLQLTRTLLERDGFCCVSEDTYEADDILASAAKQFPGKTTIVSADKDLRQCLCDQCNILLDVEWTVNELTGDAEPQWKWLTAKSHTEETGLPPYLFCEVQILQGDQVDGIQGAEGIGKKGAVDLILAFGSAKKAIQAAKANDPQITAKKRESLIAFESRLDVTRQLVTLVDTLPIPSNTRI